MQGKNLNKIYLGKNSIDHALDVWYTTHSHKKKMMKKPRKKTLEAMWIKLPLFLIRLFFFQEI